MAGYWSGLAMNIPDFTRFARSQRDQVVGQRFGLPLPPAGLAFVGVAVTSATVVIDGKPIWDPVDLAGRMEGAAVAVGLAIITIDTLCANLAANVVGPAYDFSAIFPKHVNCARGGFVTAVLGIEIMPWKPIESWGGDIFTWRVGYGALIGPVLGVMIADHWIVRRTRVDVDELYRSAGAYSYRVPPRLDPGGAGGDGGRRAAERSRLPGKAFPSTFSGIPQGFKTVYDCAWSSRVRLAVVVPLAMMAGARAPARAPRQPATRPLTALAWARTVNGPASGAPSRLRTFAISASRAAPSSEASDGDRPGPDSAIDQKLAKSSKRRSTSIRSVSTECRPAPAHKNRNASMRDTSARGGRFGATPRAASSAWIATHGNPPPGTSQA